MRQSVICIKGRGYADEASATREVHAGRAFSGGNFGVFGVGTRGRRRGSAGGDAGRARDGPGKAKIVERG